MIYIRTEKSVDNGTSKDQSITILLSHNAQSISLVSQLFQLPKFYKY